MGDDRSIELFDENEEAYWSDYEEPVQDDDAPYWPDYDGMCRRRQRRVMDVTTTTTTTTDGGTKLREQAPAATSQWVSET